MTVVRSRFVSRRRWWLWALSAVVLVLPGCGKKTAESSAAPKPGGEAKAAQEADKAAEKAEDPGKKPEKTEKKAVKLPEAATVDAARAHPPIDQAKLQELFSAWLKAQNDGDFEAYSALYAERFMGIKRSGPRMRTFKREGWLRDRKRMFGKAMKVDAEKVEIAATAESAVISFEQAWASGNYKDIGPKQLVVVRGDKGLRVAREEMLRSEVTSGESKHKKLSKDAFGFVVHGGGHAWVVLETRPNSKLAQGKPSLVSVEPFAIALRDVDLAKLAVESRRMMGRELRLMGPAGQACRGNVDKIAMMSRVRPHFGTVQYWKGEEGNKPLPEDKIAKEAWDLGDAGRLLVARIKPVKANDCGGALWGRDAEQPEPQVLKPVAIQPPLLKAGLAAFRKLKGYGEIQKSYIEMTNLPRKPQWDRYDGAAPKVSVLASEDGKQRYLAMAATAGSGCGDFIGEYWAIWRVRGTDDKPQLVLITDDRAPGRYFAPRAAVDVDGDGRLEFISPDAVLQPVGPVVRETDGIEVPNLDCPC